MTFNQSWFCFRHPGRREAVSRDRALSLKNFSAVPAKALARLKAGLTMNSHRLRVPSRLPRIMRIERLCDGAAK